ncbi:hypothetical protein Peur_049987 [Populus x canadensis]
MYKKRKAWKKGSETLRIVKKRMQREGSKIFGPLLQGYVQGMEGGDPRFSNPFCSSSPPCNKFSSECSKRRESRQDVKEDQSGGHRESKVLWRKTSL